MRLGWGVRRLLTICEVFRSPRRYLRRERRGAIGHQLLIRSLEDDTSAVFARARPQIDNMIRRAHHFGIVLHHQNRVAQIAQLFEDADQPGRYRGCADRWTVRRERSTRPPAANRGTWPAGCAALRRRKALPKAGPASDTPVRRRSGTSAAAGFRPGSLSAMAGFLRRKLERKEELLRLARCSCA